MLPAIKELRLPPDAATRLRVRPGLSSFVQTPSKAAEQVLSLVREAKEWIPLDMHGTTALYLRATAGLRLLAAAEAASIITEVKNVLGDEELSPFRFCGARIISGDEEAVFGWLAVNYMLGMLDDETYSTRAGWLDLGGGSAQIAHQLPDGVTADEHWQASRWTLPLAGGTTLVFRHSHLRLGREEAFLRLCRLLRRAARFEMNASRAASHFPVVRHPCLLVGDYLKYDGSSVSEAELGSGIESAQLLFEGVGDAMLCDQLVSRLLHSEDDCPPGRCGRLSKPFAGKYYGAGNYYHTAVLLGLATEEGEHNVTAADYQRAASIFCSLPVGAVRQAIAHSIEWRHARYGCFGGLYIAHLLHRVHNLAPNTPIAITRTVDNSPVDWTLGALIYEVAFKPLSRVRGSAWPLYEDIFPLRDSNPFVPSTCIIDFTERGISLFWCILQLAWSCIASITLCSAACVVCTACACRCLRLSGTLNRASGYHAHNAFRMTRPSWLILRPSEPDSDVESPRASHDLKGPSECSCP